MGSANVEEAAPTKTRAKECDIDEISGSPIGWKNEPAMTYASVSFLLGLFDEQSQLTNDLHLLLSHRNTINTQTQAVQLLVFALAMSIRRNKYSLGAEQ